MTDEFDFDERVKRFDKMLDEAFREARVPWWKTLWWRLSRKKRVIGGFTSGSKRAPSSASDSGTRG